MIGALVGELVATGGISLSGGGAGPVGEFRLTPSGSAALACAAALVGGVGVAGALESRAAIRREVAEVPGLRGILGGDSLWSGELEGVSGFAPWPIAAGWAYAATGDVAEAVRRAMSDSYRDAGPHVAFSVAAAVAVRVALGGGGRAAARAASVEVGAAEADGSLGEALERGLDAAFAAPSFAEVMAAAAGWGGREAAGAAGFAAGAVASARFGPPGWAYLMAIEGLDEDDVGVLSDLLALAGAAVLAGHAEGAGGGGMEVSVVPETAIPGLLTRMVRKVLRLG